jgi:hypothetical protein
MTLTAASFRRGGKPSAAWNCRFRNHLFRDALPPVGRGTAMMAALQPRLRCFSGKVALATHGHPGPNWTMWRHSDSSCEHERRSRSHEPDPSREDRITGCAKWSVSHAREYRCANAARSTSSAWGRSRYTEGNYRLG